MTDGHGSMFVVVDVVVTIIIIIIIIIMEGAQVLRPRGFGELFREAKDFNCCFGMEMEWTWNWWAYGEAGVKQYDASQ